MKMSKDLAQEVAGVHNMLCRISTVGEDTLRMASCITALRNLLNKATLLDDEEPSGDDECV